MAEFVYRVKSPTGIVREGTIEASEQRSAVEQLRARRLIVLEISEAKKNILLGYFKKISPLKKKIKLRDLVLFSRQLSTMVSAGVPIVQGLNILAEQIENPVFRKVISGLRGDIESGISIAEAMKRQPEIFSELYVAMIHAGEIGGILDIILERLSTYLESAEKLRGKVKGAMVYPAIVSLIALAVTIFLLVVVIPTFKTIFEGFGAKLPLPTQILIGLSEFLKRYVYLVIGVPVALFIGLKQWYKTEKGKTFFDTKFLKLPLFGMLLRKVAVAKFTRTLGTLVKSGVPILQAMDTVAKTSGNKVIENAIFRAKESIRDGEKIAEPLKRSAVFPPMVTQMITVGEETGNLDTMLSKIADFYDQEVDVAVASLTSMIEPLVMCLMALVIGAIVIAMFLPMFQMTELVGK